MAGAITYSNDAPTGLSIGTAPPRREYGSQQAAAPIRPVTRDALALNVPQWEDKPADTLDAKCYEYIRTTDLVWFPVLKRALQISEMEVAVKGDSEQAEFLQKCIDQSLGLPEAVEWLAKYGPTEGWTAVWIKDAIRVIDARQATGPLGQPLHNIDGSPVMAGVSAVVADLRAGGRHKANAGGTLRLVYESDAFGSRERIYKRDEYDSALAAVESHEAADLSAAELDRSRFVVYRPGAGSSPEGDLELPWMLYLLARRAQRNDANWEDYGDKWVMPVWLVKAMLDGGRSGNIYAKVDSLAQKVQDMPAGGSIGLTEEQVVQLLQAGTGSVVVMDAIEASVHRRAHRLLLHNELTSTTSSNERGDSQVQAGEQNIVIKAEAKCIAGALDQLLDYLARRNAELGVLPPLKPGEMKPYVALQRPQQSMRAGGAEARALRATDPVEADWYYEQHGAPRPEGVPDIIEPSAAPAMFDPFGLPAPAAPTSQTPAPSAPDVADAALNGAQISSLKEIIQDVSAGTLTPDAAYMLITQAFPTIKQDTAKQMVDEAGKASPPPDPKAPAPLTLARALTPAERVRLAAPGVTERNELASLFAIARSRLQATFAAQFAEFAKAEAEGRSYRIPDDVSAELSKLTALCDLAGRARLFREMKAIERRVALERDTPARIDLTVRESMQLPFDEAIQDFTRRAIQPISVAAEVNAASIASAVTRVYRTHGFTMARVAERTMLEQVKSKLDAFLETGEGNRDEFAKWFTQRNPDLPEAYADTVFRNNVNTAYSAGRAQQMREVGDEFLGGWQWVTAGDNAVRDAHAALNGKVFSLSRTDLMPPKAHNCRCTAIPVERGVKAMGYADTEAAISAATKADPKFADWIREPGAGVYGQ